MIMGRPVLYYDHPAIEMVLGRGYKGHFLSQEHFLQLLENLPALPKKMIDHDAIFASNLIAAMHYKWKSTKKAPKDAEAWIEAINSGVTDKKSIANIVNDKVRLNGTAHFIRRYLLHSGVRDNIKSPYTEYYIEGNEKTIKKDLFSGNGK